MPTNNKISKPPPDVPRGTLGGRGCVPRGTSGGLGLCSMWNVGRDLTLCSTWNVWREVCFKSCGQKQKLMFHVEHQPFWLCFKYFDSHVYLVFALEYADRGIVAKFFEIFYSFLENRNCVKKSRIVVGFCFFAWRV